MAKLTQAQKKNMIANTRKIGVGGAASLAKSVAKRVLPKIAKKAGPKIKHFMDYKGAAKVWGGAGNSVGRSGTSYKPYRK